MTKKKYGYEPLKKEIILFLVLFTFLNINCDFTDNQLKVINNADYDIYAIIDFPASYYYSFEPNELISAKDTGSVVLVNEFWSRAISEVKTINIYFIIPDSLYKYNKSNWRKNVQPLRKMVLSESQLDSLNWTLTYP